MPRRTVQFDMDGVLADFGRGYRDLAAQLGSPVPAEGAAWDELWDKRVWAFIRTSPSFWAMLRPLATPETLQRIGFLMHEHDVYFVTARPGVNVKRQSEIWLEKWGIPRPTVIVSGRKGEFARCAGITHAIDDKAGNAVFTAYNSPETASYLLDAPYNRFDQSVLGTKVRRVATVDDFLEAL